MNNNRICNSKELELLINSTPDGETCLLEEKEYYLTRQVAIKNKKGIIVDGSKATIITKYVNNDDYSASVDAFLIESCEDVTIVNFVMDTDVPTNITATVEEIDFENKTVILNVDKEFKINGDEVLMAFNSMDSDGSPDYHMNYYSKHPDPNVVTLILGEILLANTYASAKYDYLGYNRFKVYFPSVSDRLSVGERICIRHTMYGPSVFTLKDSNRTVLKNITMHHVPGMAVIVLPRCRDLTIDGLKIIAKEGSSCLMAGNCDGVHLTGLCGNFVMKNCVFDGMGDDALNIHATAGTISELINENSIRCNYCKKGPDGVLPERWCESGDTIKTYDPDTMVSDATLKVVEFKDGVLTFEELEGRFKVGDVLQNMTYAPSCIVDNCVIRNNRARGLMIQTSNVEIKNCTFFGISYSSVKVAPDFKYWYEVGPTYNFYMHHNIIEKCAYVANGDAGIGIFTKHDSSDTDVEHLHKNIRIENNIIKRSKTKCITVTAADNVIIKDNVFENRQHKDSEPISAINCSNITLINNTEI